MVVEMVVLALVPAMRAVVSIELLVNFMITFGCWSEDWFEIEACGSKLDGKCEELWKAAVAVQDGVVDLLWDLVLLPLILYTNLSA